MVTMVTQHILISPPTEPVINIHAYRITNKIGVNYDLELTD